MRPWAGVQVPPTSLIINDPLLGARDELLVVKNHQDGKTSTPRAKTAAQFFPAAGPFGCDADLGFDRAGHQLKAHRVCGCPGSDPVGVADVSGGFSNIFQGSVVVTFPEEGLLV